MTTVLSWKVGERTNYLDLPQDSQILGVRLHDEVPSILVMFPKENYSKTRTRSFLTIGHGHSFDENVKSYIGSVATKYPTSKNSCGEVAFEPILHHIFEIE